MGPATRFIVSEKDTENGAILVITDAELVGKNHQEGSRQLDLSKKFYQGEEKSFLEVEKQMERAYILHLTGKNSVALGVKLGLIDPEKVLTVKGTPHAEAVVEKG
jgi:hypothetical protein